MTNVPTDRACAAAMPWRRLSAVGRSVAVKHSRTCGAARRGAAATLAHSLTAAQTAAMDCAEACASDGHAQHARCTTRTAARDVHEAQAAARPIRCCRTGKRRHADSIRRDLRAAVARTHCRMQHAVSRDAEARKAVRRMRARCPRRHRRRAALGRRRRHSPGSRATRHSRRRHPAAQRSAFGDSRSNGLSALQEWPLSANAETDRLALCRTIAQGSASALACACLVVSFRLLRWVGGVLAVPASLCSAARIRRASPVLWVL